MLTIARVIFIHGIGLDTKEDYWKQWSWALNESLKTQGMEFTEKDFDGVYYADIYSTIEVSEIEHELEKEKFILQLQNNARKKIYRQTPLYHRGAVEELISDASKLFGQMFYYFYDEQIYEGINNRLYEKLSSVEDTVHLISFSLGSLISFCSLQQRPELAGKVKNFIMVGSPLFWLRHGMEMRSDLQTKPTVHYFTNVAGILDIANPQTVPQYVIGLDEQVSVMVNMYNPIKGHGSYFKVKNSVDRIARLLKKYYYK